MAPAKVVEGVALAKVQGNLWEKTAELARPVVFQCREFVDTVRDVVKMADEEYEWWQNETGDWYYKIKGNDTAEWILWEDDATDKDAVDVQTEENTAYHKPENHALGMDWAKSIENGIKSTNNDLFKLEDSGALESLLSLANEDKVLKKKGRVEVYPNIKPKKIIKILKKDVYKTHIKLKNSDVLMLVDDTTMKSGKSGLLVTRYGIFTRSFPLINGFLPWRIGKEFPISFHTEKGMLMSRKLMVTISDGTEHELFMSSEPDLRKNMVELPAYLSSMAQIANDSYCEANGIEIGKSFSDVAADYEGSGLNCPKCGSQRIGEAGLAGRGGKALLRGFAGLDRSLVSKMPSPNTRSIFGRSGGMFDKMVADKRYVCKECGKKF